MKCDGCTACCKMFPIQWLDKPAWTACKHCDKGCLVHDTKDKECSEFNCAYIQMEKANVALRPDNCGVVFEKMSDDIMFGTINPDKEITDIAKQQIRVFIDEGLSVILHKKDVKVPMIYAAEGTTQKEVYTKVKELSERKKVWLQQHT